MRRKTLAELKRGQRGRVLKVGVRDPATASRLLRLGVLPGMIVRLVQSSPSVIFSVDETWIAVDRETAAQVLVEER